MNSKSEEDWGINEQEGRSGPVSSVNFIEAAQRRDALSGATERGERERMFLQACIFADIPALNPSWDSAQVDHFTRIDFLIVLDRCSEAGIEVFGVEVFSRDGIFMDMNIPISSTDLSHYDFVKSFPDQPRLNFSASYGFDGVSLDSADQSRQNA